MTPALRSASLTVTLAILSAPGLVASTPEPSVAEPEEPPVALRAARIFDGVDGELLEDGVVVVQGETIQAVGPGLDIPASAEVIDLGDSTLLPGFIDAHTHLTGQMGDDWYRDFYEGMLRFATEQAHYAARYARRTLEAGFTTVRNVGAGEWVDIGLRNAIRDEVILGPRILTAAHSLGSTGGHCDQGPYPPDRVPPADTMQGTCDGPEECREAVRQQMKFGADVIKICASGGVLSLADPVDVPQLTAAELAAIIGEAHRWGRKVAAHSHGDAAARLAIQAGVDSIEHGTFLTDDTLRLMRREGVYLVPTLFAGWWVGEKADGYPPAVAEKARAAAAQMQEMFARAVEIGTPIAFGTDAGVEPHGQNAREFSLMTENGMPPAQALLAATREAAELLGIADHVGTLEAGKAADIIAVPGNPLGQIQTTERVHFVMRAGEVVVRESASPGD